LKAFISDALYLGAKADQSIARKGSEEVELDMDKIGDDSVASKDS
jgi:hypothetical protein